MNYEMVALIWFLAIAAIALFLHGAFQNNKECEDAQAGVQNGLPGNPMTDYEVTKSKKKITKKKIKKRKK